MRLGGDHQLVARAGDELAEQRLRFAARVHVGAIEEVDACLAATREHAPRCRFVRVTAERHGAKAQPRDLNTRATESAIFHASGLITGSRRRSKPARAGLPADSEGAE